MSDIGQAAVPDVLSAGSTIHSAVEVEKKPLSVDAQHALDMESELQKTSTPTVVLQQSMDVEEQVEVEPENRYRDVLETKDDMTSQSMANPEAVAQGHNTLTMHQQFTNLVTNREQQSKVNAGASGVSKESMADFIAKGHEVSLSAHLGLMVVFSAGKGEGVDEQRGRGVGQEKSEVGNNGDGLAAAQNAAVRGSKEPAQDQTMSSVGQAQGQIQGQPLGPTQGLAQQGKIGGLAAGVEGNLAAQVMATQALVAKTEVATEKNTEFANVLTEYEARIQQPGGNRFSDKEVADFESKRAAAQAAVKSVLGGLGSVPPILLGGAGRWAAAAIVNSSLEAYDLLKFNAYEDREAGIKFNALGYKQGIDVGRLEKAAYDIEADKEMDQAVVSGVGIAVALVGGIVPCLGQAGKAACDMVDHIIGADAAEETGEVKQMEAYARALQSVYSQAADSAKQGSQAENKLMESILQAIEKLTRTMAQQFSIGVR